MGEEDIQCIFKIALSKILNLGNFSILACIFPLVIVENICDKTSSIYTSELDLYINTEY